MEDPLTLATMALAGQSGWDHAAIDAAMHGATTVRVAIARSIAVYVLYQTVVVGDDGMVHRYDDIDGHDARLARALAAARSLTTVRRR